MSALPCPHCKKPTISWWQKYKAAKWALIYCRECHGKSCSYPYVLVAYTMLYVWDLMLFGALAYLDQNAWYILVMVVFWVILDIFSVYLPLSPMKSKSKTP
ncbi:MAG: hypothetical protein PVF34_03125 [Gammaproteobacteria bacterium]|jgi:hypothetical protein|nr:hypothetical protein [Gammaproteobacteria bacterium]